VSPDPVTRRGNATAVVNQERWSTRSKKSEKYTKGDFLVGAKTTANITSFIRHDLAPEKEIERGGGGSELIGNRGRAIQKK